MTDNRVFARYCLTCKHVYGATNAEFTKWGPHLCIWCKMAGGNHLIGSVTQ